MDAATLTINIIANTASFDQPLDRSADKAKRSARGIQDSLNGMNFSEARGGLVLIDDLLGVHLPRHAASFISQLPGMAGLMAAAFPAAVVAIAGKAIYEAFEKLQKHREEVEKNVTAILDLGVATGQHAAAIGISNLKLQDQIAILQRRPATNGPRIMAEEARTAVAKLVAEFEKAVTEQAKLLKGNQQNLFLKLLDGSDGSRELAGMAASHAAVVNSIVSMRKIAQDAGNKAEVAANDVLLAQEHASYKKNIDGRLSILQAAIAKEIGLRQKGLVENQYGVQFKSSYGMQDAVTATRQVMAAHAQELVTLSGLVIEQSNYNKELAAEGAHTKLAKIDYAAERLRKEEDLHDRLGQHIREIADAVEKHQESATDKIVQYNLAAYGKELKDRLHGNEQLLEAFDAQGKSELKISQLTRDISDGEAQRAAKLRVALGLTTEQSAAQQAMKTLERDKAAALDQINTKLSSQLALVKLLEKPNGTAAEQTAYRKGLADYNEFQAQKLEITKKYDKEIGGLTLQLANNERSQWRKMALDWKQINTEMSQAGRQMLGSFNSSLAQFITTGKADWRSLAASAVQDIIKIGLQWVESKIIMAAANAIFGEQENKTAANTIASNVAMATSDAGLSAANTLALTSAVYLPPIPEGLAAAALGAGLTFAGFASAARGGLLGNHETLVHTHPQEMILPAHISNFIVSRVGQGGGGEVHHHHYNTFAPIIQAVDEHGVDRMLDKHGDRFFAKMKSELRKNGLR